MPHSAWQAASALRGKRVVLSGDSMVRQLFIRLVAALRGATVVAQPAQFVFHSSAIYAMNGTHDWLCVRPWQGEGQVTLGPPCAPPPVERPWVTLRYLWSPERLPSEAPAPGAPPDPEGLTAADLAADVTVAGLMFWLPWNDTLKAHLPAMSAAAARSRRLFWLATPGEHYAPRNDAVRAWARGQPAVRVLALDKLRADGSYTEQDWHHFECKVDLRLCVLSVAAQLGRER